MPKPTMLRRVLRKEKEDRGSNAPVLLSALAPGLVRLLRRLGSTSRGYALAGAGVVVGAVVVVSLLSWLAPDSDRPITSPLEVVGRVAGGVLEQVDDQAEALLGTNGESVLRSVREGLAAASSATPWPGNPAEIAASPYSGKASPDEPASSSTDDAAAPTQGESSSASDGTSSQTPSSAPSGPSETPTSTDAPSAPATSEPPVAEEPSTPPPAEEPPVVEEPAPPEEEPVPPPAEEPPPVAEESPPVPSDPPPAEEPPQTIPAD